MKLFIGQEAGPWPKDREDYIEKQVHTYMYKNLIASQNENYRGKERKY